MIDVRPYSASLEQAWNSVVLNSRTGTFLHLRQYMDYHAARYVDKSLMVFNNGEPVAVFPANAKDAIVSSHGGLTYGGLISLTEMKAVSAIEALKGITSFYADAGYSKLFYKAVPHIFHRYPSEEDLYALHQLGARLKRRDLSSVVEIGKAPKYSKGRKWTINKAKKVGLVVKRTMQLDDYYALLHQRASDLDRQITHSLDELKLLAGRFPDQIVLYESRLDHELQAGILVYDFGLTVHTQYMGASDAGRTSGALDLIISELVNSVYADRRYFSFGISTEQNGQVLNAGLVAQKEGFGARAVVHDFYELDI